MELTEMEKRMLYQTEGQRKVAAIGLLSPSVFSVPTERAAIANGNDLRGLGTCHQQAFSQILSQI